MKPVNIEVHAESEEDAVRRAYEGEGCIEDADMDCEICDPPSVSLA